MRTRFVLPLLALILLVRPAAAPADVRPREPMGAGEMRLALKKLRVLGSALYVAAHPDDENTAFLSWLESEKLVRTGYLSLTRGDGGQNLIGSETGELLGVIRTQELLAARRLDGAEQFFTRALDFGFSKTPEETMAFWGHDSVLSDVVRVIRTFRPDVIVTRFPTDGSGGHGHHTASAMLAEEAFVAAADPNRFPELGLPAWKTKRIMWNVFRRDTSRAVPTTPTVTIDLGAYNPLLGRSYTEIAGLSRSMHKSQGFGAPERRGSIPNDFELRAGDPPTGDLFDGVAMGWTRIRGSEAADRLLADAERDFDPQHPDRILPTLLHAHAALEALGDDPLVLQKKAELLDVIRSAGGLWMEAIAASPSASPGGRVRVTATMLNRSPAALTLERVEMPLGAAATLAAANPGAGLFGVRSSNANDGVGGPVRDRALEANRPVAAQAMVSLPATFPITQPYWLVARPGRGLFQVADRARIGAAENAPPLVVRFVVRSGDERLAFDVPVVYRWTDPVAGERYRPFEVVPPVTARFDRGVYLFPDRAARDVRVTVGADSATAASVRLALPDGWRVEPAKQSVTLKAGGEETVSFRVTPGAAGGAAMSAVVEANGREWSHRLVRLDYPHIPMQTLYPPAEARLVRTDLAHTGASIGYVMGPGDAVPEALREMGYRVTLLTDEDLESADLSRYDAVVTGVRAWNTRPRLRALRGRLLAYVERGGRLVTQYVTPEEAVKDVLGPWPLTVSRDRVTVEEAPIQVLKPGHPLLTRPNKIGDADWQGWVQERGLWYANPFDPRYEAVIASHDPGEPERTGGLLFTRYGKGTFVYTGYAWFRQLPAGVPGAWRLFANLVSAK